LNEILLINYQIGKKVYWNSTDSIHSPILILILMRNVGVEKSKWKVFPFERNFIQIKVVKILSGKKGGKTS
jgi:hypothetical protein